MENETDVEIETIKIIKERNKKGRETYGKGLDYTDVKYNWLDMAIEEAADLLKYLVAEKLKQNDTSVFVKRLEKRNEELQNEVKKLRIWLPEVLKERYY